MNCYLHPETPATAFCRSCGRPLCVLCQQSADGTIYCQDHVPGAAYANANAASAANPYVQPPPLPGNRVQTSPGLAFLFGLIPGVGAIYNGQYIKGLVHAVIFGLLVTVISNTDGPGVIFLGILLSAFYFYMPFEAYHTAKKRQSGIAVDELSSLMGQSRYGSRAPVGPIILIAIGLLFLLDTLHVVAFRDIGRFWPVILILAGAYMLYARVSSGPRAPLERPYAPPYTPPDAKTSATHIVETRNE